MSDDLYEAVSQKMQPQWTSLSGSCFDSVETLERKRAKLENLKQWAAAIDDRATRKAYQRYFGIVEYTINHGLEEHAQRKRNSAIIPSLPTPPG